MIYNNIRREPISQPSMVRLPL